MILVVPAVLPPDACAEMCARLEAAGPAWVDGRATAGHQGERVKDNLQIAEDAPIARELGDRVLDALEKNRLFISAALPQRIYPPMFNRYAGDMHFGAHVDGAVRLIPEDGEQIRTDVSATLFLSPPESYDGGELQIVEAGGTQSVKLPAGHMVLYPSTKVHRVTPVTRGVRLGSFFWVQSMIRDETRRALLLDFDLALVRLNQALGDHESLVSLTGCYHNLLRQWAEV